MNRFVALVLVTLLAATEAKSHVSGAKMYLKTNADILGWKYVTCQWEHSHNRHWIVLADFEEAVPFVVTHDSRVSHKKGKLKYKDPIMLSCMHGEHMGLKDLKSFLAAGPAFATNSWTLTYKGDMRSTKAIETGDEAQLEVSYKEAIGSQQSRVFSSHAANFDPARRTMTSIKYEGHVLSESTLVVEFVSDVEAKAGKSEL